jgi:hypothetical protein
VFAVLCQGRLLVAPGMLMVWVVIMFSSDCGSMGLAGQLHMPLDEYPGYNYIGLIVGPRGNTQKHMERVRPGCCCHHHITHSGHSIKAIGPAPLARKKQGWCCVLRCRNSCPWLLMVCWLCGVFLTFSSPQRACP